MIARSRAIVALCAITLALFVAGAAGAEWCIIDTPPVKICI